jgi:hypothetical protein
MPLNSSALPSTLNVCSMCIGILERVIVAQPPKLGFRVA